MTKAELIDQLHAKHAGAVTKRLVGELVEEMFDAMAKTLKKETRFAYPGFGTWTVRNRPARKGRNPATGEVIQIKKSKTVGFRPAKSLKTSL
jgi:DNA-binding protein HU-beta